MNPKMFNIANVPAVSAFEMSTKEGMGFGPKPVTLEVGQTAVNAAIDPTSLGGVSAFAKDVVDFKFANQLANNQARATEAAKAAADEFTAYELTTKKQDKDNKFELAA